MTTKISEKGWKEAYYGKWLKAQEKTRRKVKWNKRGFLGFLVGWKSLKIWDKCSYCAELISRCSCCSFGSKNKNICLRVYPQYIEEMNKPRTNWQLTNSLVDQIVSAIHADGVEWGYIKEGEE
jgi:hypothetical protein